MSLRPLLDQDTNSPMIVVNGADDIHVPQADTLVFRDRRDTRVELLPDTGHCAVSKLGDGDPADDRLAQRDPQHHAGGSMNKPRPWARGIFAKTSFSAIDCLHREALASRGRCESLVERDDRQ